MFCCIFQQWTGIALANDTKTEMLKIKNRFEVCIKTMQNNVKMFESIGYHNSFAEYSNFIYRESRSSLTRNETKLERWLQKKFHNKCY